MFLLGVIALLYECSIFGMKLCTFMTALPESKFPPGEEYE